MSTFDEDCIPIDLKDSIDLDALKNPNSDGVMLEINEQQDGFPEEAATVPEYDEKIYNRWRDDAELSDSESDDDLATIEFDKLKKKMIDITPDKNGKILKKLIKEGSGCIIPHSSLVRVHHNAFLDIAFLEGKDEPYDSTRLRNEPQRLRLGHGDVIPGYDVAVSTMRKGELSQFIIHPDLAYGKMGCPPRIPPAAEVLFDIEVIDFIDQEGMDEYYFMTEQEKRKLNYDGIKKVWRGMREEAMQHFKTNQFKSAFSKYRKASEIIENYRLKNDKEEEAQASDLQTVYINMALCSLRLSHNGRAVTYANKALDIQRNNAKALYLKAQGLHNSGHFDQAKKEYKKAQKLKPNDPDIMKKLEKLDKDMINFKVVEKDIYGKMFPMGKTESKSDIETREAEIKREKEKEAKCEKCSTEFKSLVDAKIREFEADKDLVEIPFPIYNLSVGEIHYILTAATEAGLDIHQRGSGDATHMTIAKKIR